MLRLSIHRRIAINVSSKQAYSKGFVQSLLEKIKEESSRDAELKESIRKFREETEKLGQSKEVQSVRELYKKIERELPTDTVDKVRGTLQQMSEKLREESSRITSNDALKSSLENLSRATEQLKDATKSLGQTEMIKAALRGIEVVDKELQSDRAKVYVPLKTLKTRAEVAGKFEEKMISPDNESSGVVLHKDSKWYGAWQDFKDNNRYVQRFFDIKAQYEESDHVAARSLRFVTDRVSQLFGGGSTNELQIAMDEIIKLDPNFDVGNFLHYCRFVAIPNVLEALVRWDYKILSDWCHEGAAGILSTNMKELQRAGYVPCSRILDISNVDLQTGKMTEQGPILVISFQAQQIECIRGANGEIYSGDPDKVLRISYIWALCRNQDELHPWAAWRVLDVASMPAEQWI